MEIKKHIPNLFSLGNLFSGILATLFAVHGEFEFVAIFVSLGIFLDFFDGYFARILTTSSDLGKQLDSLADMVTSGVVPGIVMFNLLENKEIREVGPKDEFEITSFMSFLALILTLGACYRLAKFNIDTRQSKSFIGLPTPAMSLLVVFLPLVQIHTEVLFLKEIISNCYFLIGLTLILSYLMNAEISFFSLKFKDFSFKDNEFKYLLISLSIILVILYKYLAIPFIIIIYIILSMIKNLIQRG